MKISGAVVILTTALFLSACSTSYEQTALKSWDLMKNGQQDEALKLYEKNVTSEKEKLLRLMDEGILLRTANRFEESNKKLLEAAKIIEMNGYLSLGEQAVTLLTNEKQTIYQGEDFEKVLVHVFLGLNFISLKNYEEALIETRKVNEILFKMISEGKRPYELNAFARYVNANLFEADKDENNALVDYRNTLKIAPELEKEFPAIGEDLIRMSRKMGMSEEADEFRKKFGENIWKAAEQSLQKKMGAIVFLFESGKSPQKYSSRENHRTHSSDGNAVDVLLPIAHYRSRETSITRAKLEVGGQSARTLTFNNIEQTAIKHLQDRMGRAIAKALLTASVKVGVGVAIGKATNNADLGALAALLLMAASEADTRSWLLLPQKLQIAKIFLLPGKYNLRVSYEDASGNPVRTEEIPNVEVKANQTQFIQRRSFD